MNDQQNHGFPPEPDATPGPGHPDQFGMGGQPGGQPYGQPGGPPVRQPAWQPVGGPADAPAAPPRRGRGRGRTILTAVVGVVAALVAAAVVRTVTDDSPDEKEVKPRALVSPDVPAGFSLVRDDANGFAMIVPTSYENFDFSQENLAALQKGAANNPRLAGLMEQFTSPNAQRPTMFRIDYDTGDNINLIATDVSPHGTLPVGLEDTAASTLKQQLGVTITDTGTRTIDGRKCLQLSYRLPDPDVPGGLPGTQVYVPGTDHLYIATVTSTQISPADLDRIVGSLRVK